MRFILLVLVLGGLVLLASVAAAAGPVEVSGKVAVDSIGVAGVRVSAWPLDTLSFVGEAPFRSEPSSADGHFRLELPPGAYYFLASGPGLSGYYGRNPVTVDRKGLKGVNLSMPRNDPALPEGQPKQMMAGVLAKITYAGKALEGAVLMVYTDLNTQLKGMGLGLTAPSDAAGIVEFPLTAGTYYVVARKRQSGQFTGPLKSGDFFGYYAGNPLVVKDGEVVRLGIDMVEVPKKVERLADSLFGKTSISGRILNTVGAPVAGVRVLLYTDSMMLNRPLYVSQLTGIDGKYVISFPKGGTYYLAARDKLGGAPATGELYGRYSGSADSSIRVRTGQHLEDVDLSVQEMW